MTNEKESILTFVSAVCGIVLAVVAILVGIGAQTTASDATVKASTAWNQIGSMSQDVSELKVGGSVIENLQTDFVNGLKVAGALVFSNSSGVPAMTLGTSGTAITQIQTGTCNAATTLLPLEATSTDAFTCTVTGAATGDRAFVILPSYDLVFGGLSVSGATVSTNTITFTILNSSGAATSSFPLATTSVKYFIYR